MKYLGEQIFKVEEEAVYNALKTCKHVFVYHCASALL